MNKNLMKPPEKEGKFRNLMNAAFPRVSALNGRVAPWSARAGIASLADLASLPGRAYVSIGRPEGESYMSALGRTEPRYDMASYQGEGDELAESILRDPTLPLGVGLGRLASGLGKVGRVALDALGNAGMTAGSQYATSGQVDPIAVAMAAGLGAAPHAMPGKAPVSRMTSEITPEQRAANFKNWFGDSKVVDAGGKPLVVYHGGKSIVDDFSRGPYRGILGAGYFSDSPRTAMQYAIAGGSPQKNESLSDLLRLMKKQAPNRTPVVTKAHLSIKNPVDITSNNAYREIFETFAPREIDEITKGVWIGDKLDRLYQNGDINEWKPFLETIKDDPEMFRGPTGANDDFAVGNSPAFNFLATTGQLDEFMKRRGYDGFIFPDQETGTNTYVPLSPTQIKSATGNRGTFDPTDPNITHFAGRSPIARQSTPIQALGNRLSAGAKQAVFRNLMGGSQNRGDTYYTKGGSR